MRPRFIEKLLEEIEATDPDLFCPKNEFNINDKKLGVVPLYARKVYALRQFYDREHAQMDLDQRFGAKRDEARHEECILKVEVLGPLFWALINDEVNGWGRTAKDMCIRQGWLIVEESR